MKSEGEVGGMPRLEPQELEEFVSDLCRLRQDRSRALAQLPLTSWAPWGNSLNLSEPLSFRLICYCPAPACATSQTSIQLESPAGQRLAAPNTHPPLMELPTDLSPGRPGPG